MGILAPSYASIGSLVLSNIEPSGVTFVLQDVKGWGAPQGTLAPTQKPRSGGAWVGSSYAQGRTIVLTGTVYGPTPALASDALDRLIAAATLDLAVLTIVEGGGRSRFTNVRRDGPVIETWTNSLVFTYSIQLFAPDARKFGTALVGVTYLPASTGGLQWPEQWPEVWSAATVSGTVSLTNPGNAAGPVVLRVDGPAAGPQIAHAGTTGTAITFSSSLILNSGEWITINMDTRKALANDQSNRAGYITNRGWSLFDPGINVWSFSASSYSALSMLTVTATPAWS